MDIKISNESRSREENSAFEGTTLRKVLRKPDFLDSIRKTPVQLEFLTPSICRRILESVDATLAATGGGYGWQRENLAYLAQLCRGMESILAKYEILAPAA